MLNLSVNIAIITPYILYLHHNIIIIIAMDEEYDTFGAVLIDGDCLMKDFDNYDLNGEILEGDGYLPESNLLFE